MKSKLTKQKIRQAALKLFNKQGLVNVRLQHIADETGISVGNLAYHYKNKEAIVAAVNSELQEEASAILSAYRVFSNLIDFDNQLSKYFSFLQKYPFYFLDLLELDRHYPDQSIIRRDFIIKMNSQIQKRLAFNIERGILNADISNPLLEHLTNSIWVLIAFGIPQQLIRTPKEEIQITTLKEMVWQLLYPHFTFSGKMEYEKLISPILS